MKKTILTLVIMLAILALPIISYATVIFEDDFSFYTGSGWTTSCSGLFKAGPNNWNASKCGANNTLDIIDNAGLNGTPALRLGYDITPTPGATSLLKHLTNNKNTGYDELYVRYTFQFGDNWISGSDGTDMKYWKWLRLWQGVSPTDTSEWTEYTLVSRYILAQWSGTSWSGNVCHNAIWSDNADGHSAGGPRYVAWYDKQDPVSSTDGCMKSIPGLTVQKPGDANPGYFTSYPAGSQTWHTVEWHFKLSTTQSGNGVFEMWLDGVPQKLPMPYGDHQGGASMDYLNTMSYNGGMNFLTVFDNMADWTIGWGATQRYIYLDEVVVSDAYIGPDVAGCVVKITATGIERHSCTVTDFP